MLTGSHTVNAANLDPTDTTLSGKSVHAQLGLTISGHITDVSSNPLNEMWVYLQYENGQGQGVCTNVQGFYTLTNVTFNTNFRLGSGGTHPCSGAQDFIHEFYKSPGGAGGGTYNWGAALFNITTDQTDMDIQLDHGVTVSGTITNSGGTLAYMTVGFDFNGFGMGACTDQYGDYFIVVPANTDFRLKAGGFNNCGGGTQGYAQKYYKDPGGTYNPNEATSFNQPVGTTLTDKDIQLDSGVSISGTVSDSSGTLANMGMNLNYDGWGTGGGCTD